ncbi:SDR family NAD(P)-dependent oxidoreductase [Dactylosporangium fulvum]|uniref:SDR family oxidoreductase n=1 Tax=Dactylosporangium fulvum TaxID=53359 RepID=A0ABY5VZ48_9ACTN|nr:SDR family oxidoreductase [Dactylosporangium fulvum]UWP82386.1 SDR family oxidoreductase [Dactylosporangium fulvum]
MDDLDGKTLLVTGATANIGALIAAALTKRGARVFAPTRSPERLASLATYIEQEGGAAARSRLIGVPANLVDDAADLARLVKDKGGRLHGVVASIGDFVVADSVLTATTSDLRRALDGYVTTHHAIARAFVPLIKESGGTYLFAQGPLAFDIYPHLGTDLISIATAAQHMLFKVVAEEVRNTTATVIEMVVHAFIRDRETQPGSEVPAEAIGPFALDLLFGTDALRRNGDSVHLTTDGVAGGGSDRTAAHDPARG